MTLKLKFQESTFNCKYLNIQRKRAT